MFCSCCPSFGSIGSSAQGNANTAVLASTQNPSSSRLGSQASPRHKIIIPCRRPCANRKHGLNQECERPQKGGGFHAASWESHGGIMCRWKKSGSVACGPAGDAWVILCPRCFLRPGPKDRPANPIRPNARDGGKKCVRRPRTDLPGRNRRPTNLHTAATASSAAVCRLRGPPSRRGAGGRL